MQSKHYGPQQEVETGQLDSPYRPNSTAHEGTDWRGQLDSPSRPNSTAHGRNRRQDSSIRQADQTPRPTKEQTGEDSSIRQTDQTLRPPAGTGRKGQLDSLYRPNSTAHEGTDWRGQLDSPNRPSSTALSRKWRQNSLIRLADRALRPTAGNRLERTARFPCRPNPTVHGRNWRRRQDCSIRQADRNDVFKFKGGNSFVLGSLSVCVCAALTKPALRTEILYTVCTDVSGCSPPALPVAARSWWNL